MSVLIDCLKRHSPNSITKKDSLKKTVFLDTSIPILLQLQGDPIQVQNYIVNACMTKTSTSYNKTPFEVKF